jgi:hypothetical protein
METWSVWGIIPILPQVIPLYLHIRNEIKGTICIQVEYERTFDLFIISCSQAGASFVSYRHTSILKNHS